MGEGLRETERERERGGGERVRHIKSNLLIQHVTLLEVEINLLGNERPLETLTSQDFLLQKSNVLRCERGERIGNSKEKIIIHTNLQLKTPDLVTPHAAFTKQRVISQY